MKIFTLSLYLLLRNKILLTPLMWAVKPQVFNRTRNILHQTIFTLPSTHSLKNISLRENFFTKYDEHVLVETQPISTFFNVIDITTF